MATKPPKPLDLEVGPDRVTHVAGLDTASNRSHLWCNNGWASHIVCPDKMGPDERRHKLFDWATVAFQLLPVGTLLVVEEPLALQNGKTTRLLGLAAGAIWAAHLGCDIFWVWADVSAWKKLVIGQYNADKETIAEWVRANLDLDFSELGAAGADYYDAVALARYGELSLYGSQT